MTRIGRSLHPRGRTPSISYNMLAETREISTANYLRQRQRMSPSRHTSLALCPSHRPARALQSAKHPGVIQRSRRASATAPQQPRSSSEQERETGLRSSDVVISRSLGHVLLFLSIIQMIHQRPWRGEVARARGEKSFEVLGPAEA